MSILQFGLRASSFLRHWSFVIRHLGLLVPSSSLWQRFQRYFLYYRDLDFSLDISRMKFPEDFFEKMQPKVENAFAAMRELEAGAIANPTEKRMVGHYWLRNPALAPTAEIRNEIEDTLNRVKKFAEDVHAGKITAENGKRFRHVLLIGIGGSALGPQFVADALGSASAPMDIFFFDNTDADGFDRVFDRMNDLLSQTLVVVVSKSGGTKETRNGMLEAEERFKEKALRFNRHAVAVTGVGSELDKAAEKNEWVARFPMHDWVGGRTSVMSAVGLLPMALEGFDINRFLAGAAAMDERTRAPDVAQNAAMLLALMWYYAGNGKGDKDMVILPYKDRLALFAKYLQQLVMESLGKEKDLDGMIVHQGIAVYGNKGSTDQHAYVQQLRDGVLNFFVTFIEVRKDRSAERFEVEDDVTSGDYLQGFLRGTRSALYESGRESITISISEVNAFNLGALIALYERAVGFYAWLVNINAYDQPGVEAGKKAATKLLQLQKQVSEKLATDRGQTAEEIARSIDADPEDVFHALGHLASNDPHVKVAPGQEAAEDQFSLEQ
ncbi:MAG: glucose-6-phosphate isomerase [Verrucomicrobia bacterium]|nr:MAG: glucose-6-phosphate isomerase [Verrucomicrobiota bacterium]